MTGAERSYKKVLILFRFFGSLSFFKYSSLVAIFSERRAWLISVSATLPALPHLFVEVQSARAILGTVCYVPMLVIFTRPLLSPLSAAALGAAHGAMLAVAAAWWAFAIDALPIAVPLVAMIAASIYYALILGATRLAVEFISGNQTSQQFKRLSLGGLALAVAEFGRSSFVEAPLPLGTMYQLFALPFLLPFVAHFGIFALSVFGYMLNVAVSCLAFTALRYSGFFALALLGSALVVANVATQSKSGMGLPAGLVLCAYSDEARRQPGILPYKTGAWLEARIAAARRANCDIVAFPASTVAVTINSAPPAIWTASEPHLPTTVLGATIATEIRNGEPILGQGSANSVCLAAVDGEHIKCVQRVDKRFLIPLVETDLFQRLPRLRALGTYLTEAVMGAANPTTSWPGPTFIDGPRTLRIGILNCIEIFIPLYRQIDGDGRLMHPDLLLAVADHSAFPFVRTLRTLDRDAARLQSAAAGTPLLYVSTDEAALFTATGEVVEPTIRHAELFVWRL